MKKSIFAFMLAFVLLTYTNARADVSFSIGTGNFYVSVGDYDYLPYAFAAQPGYVPPQQISFYTALGQYGNWVSVSPFGQVWRPYASNGWRPYYYGHWIYTQYGPTWEGYEPWAWIGYHYGNWAFLPNLGWVWVPGYEYHGGRVVWGQGYDSVGWMPMPPSGYDYSRGSLSYVGPQNQFSYQDNDFGYDGSNGYYNSGGPYNDPRYRNMYDNSGSSNINFNLWVFINGNDFNRDNYADYAYGPDYTRYAFNQRLVRITSRQPDRTVLERVTHQSIAEVPVEVHQLQTDKQAIKVVVPKGSQQIERVRQQSREVVRDVIAPGFAEKQKPFKGQNARNKTVDEIFQQQDKTPQVETLSASEVIQRAHQSKATHEQKILEREQVAKQSVEVGRKEGKIRGPKNENQPPQQNQKKQQQEPVQLQPQPPQQPQIENPKRQPEQQPQVDQPKPPNQKNVFPPRQPQPSQPVQRQQPPERRVPPPELQPPPERQPAPDRSLPPDQALENTDPDAQTQDTVSEDETVTDEQATAQQDEQNQKNAKGQKKNKAKKVDKDKKKEPPPYKPPQRGLVIMP